VKNDRFRRSIMLIQVLDVYRLRSERVNEIPKGGVVVWCRKGSSEMSAGIDVDG
jgi:hypothetical protein